MLAVITGKPDDLHGAVFFRKDRKEGETAVTAPVIHEKDLEGDLHALEDLEEPEAQFL
jgi:hypothetical protein